MRYAEHQAFLDQIEDDGKTLRQHLLVAQRGTGRTPRQLDGPKLPEYGESIWDLFCRLSSSRRAGIRIGYHDIAAYCSVSRMRLAQWEIDALWRLDAAMANPKDHTEEP